MMNKIILLSLFVTQLSVAYAVTDKELATFPGRISRLSSIGKLVRVKVDVENVKFLNKGNRVEFWNETYPNNKCDGFVEGKSTEYVLLKVPRYKFCIAGVHVTVGTYLHMYSPELESNIGLAKELVEVLLKKRMAINARKRRFEKEVSAHVEKVDAVNKRYEVLRQKLEIEWKKEISGLEEDRAKNEMHFREAQMFLNDIDHKLQKYRVQDQNLKEDRWSLDPRLYLKK